MSATAKRAGRRGSIDVLRSGSLRVRVYAGLARDTRRQRYLSETVPTGPNAEQEIEQARLRLIATVDQERALRRDATLDELIIRHIALMPGAATTKRNYRGYFRRHIHPLIGHLPLRHITSETLDELYAELARCRKHCTPDSEPGPCDECQPLSAGTIRKFHFLISGAYRAARRWQWTTTNPAKDATPPPKTPPRPRPPTPEEVTRILTRAWEHPDPSLAVILWTAITTGARRGELCALRWSNLDTDRQALHLRASIAHDGDRLIEKDTKLRHDRHVALDRDTTHLLSRYRDHCQRRAAACGTELAPDGFLFSTAPDGTACPAPASLGQRFRRLVTPLGIRTTLHKLRHYNATELIRANVDLRTVAGRLGHRDCSTTLTTYSAFINEANQHASNQLLQRLPLRLATTPHHHQAVPPPPPAHSPYQQIAATLRDAITQRTYPPGSHLPPIHTLAAHYRVAPSTIHRATTQLARWNLVTTTPGHPTTINPNPPTNTHNPTNTAIPPLAPNRTPSHTTHHRTHPRRHTPPRHPQRHVAGHTRNGHKRQRPAQVA